MDVTGKTIVVTGAGSGMGRELTLLLLKKGARVAGVDLNPASLAETCTLTGDHQEKLSTHVLNITDREAVSRLPEEVIRLHGNVDGIVNNAGIIQPFVKIKDLEFKDMERVFNVNFWGMVNVTKAFLPYLLQRPEAHIINTSSMGGYLPVPGQTIYGASKAAVKLFTEGLHSELLSTKVHVTVVFPGAVATNITTNSGISAPPGGATAESSKFKTTSAVTAAKIILDGIEKNKYHVFIGSDASMMSRLSRLMPYWAAQLIYNQMRSLLAD